MPRSSTLQFTSTCYTALMTTNFYVDFDGVINAVSRIPALDNTTWSPDAWRVFKAKGYTINFNTEVVEAIKELESNPDNVFHWLTSWCSDAPRLLSQRLGIGSHWPVVGEYLYHHQEVTRGWWKGTAATEHVSATHPKKVVWIDDDFGYFMGQTESVYESNAHGPVLRVMPQMKCGLEKRHFETITQFLAP